MNKFIKGDEVAILYSPTYGAGWYSWNDETPQCLYDPDIVQMVLDEEGPETIKREATKKWPEGYWAGADGLRVKWLTIGTQFQIEEYDGNESFRFAHQEWMVA